MESGLMRTFCSFLITQTRPKTVGRTFTDGSTLICRSKKPQKASGIKPHDLRLRVSLGYIQTEMCPDVQKAG